MLKDMLRRLALAVALFGGFLALGTVGYTLIEKWPPLESFYMTLITLSTVGFGEIRELSPVGRLFTSFLILGGIGSFCYAFSLITEAIVSGQLTEALAERRNRRRLAELRGHYIVYGFGKVGRRLTEILENEGLPFCVIEREESRLKELIELDIPWVRETIKEGETLREAGITRARGLFLALGDEFRNTHLALVAKEINPQVKVVVRVSSPSLKNTLARLGVEETVSPERVGAYRMFLRMVRPEVADFIEEAGINHQARTDEILFEKFRLAEVPREKIRILDGLYALMIKRKDGSTLFVDQVQDLEEADPEDVVVLIGHERDFIKLKERKI